MAINLLLYLFQLHLLEVQIHFSTILCTIISKFPPVFLGKQDILNFNAMLAGCSFALRPNMLISMPIVERALGGRRARKLRAVLPERPLNGEKVALTEVMYFVSILRTWITDLNSE